MEEIEICKPIEEDAFQICQMINTAIGLGNSMLTRDEEEIAEAIRDSRFVVALAPGKAVGCASLEEYGIAELRSLIVDKNYRGRGLGKGLVRAVEDIAKERGHKKLYAFADEDKRLLKFYRGLNFKDMGRFMKDRSPLKINKGTSAKMAKYCQECGKYNQKICQEHVLYKELAAI